MSKARGSARTPKKNRPTPSRAGANASAFQVEHPDTGLLLDVETALAWLSLNPQMVLAWTASHDAAVKSVFDGLAPANGDGEDRLVIQFFSRVTLCALWVRHARPSLATVVDEDERVGWEVLADIYDVPAIVEVWRAGRVKSLADRSHREARRAMRLIRTPADLPPGGTP